MSMVLCVSSATYAMYSPSDADIQMMDDLAITINTMWDNDPNRLVAIANKIVDILPTLNTNGRAYYVLDWIYDTIDLVIQREREQLAIRMAMMESQPAAPVVPPTETGMDDVDDADHSDMDMDHSDTDDMDDTSSDMNMDDTASATEESTWASIQVDITGNNYSFSESNIYVSLGDTVTINFESTEWTHDWKIDEFDAATDVVTSADGVTSVTFVVDTLGTFEYYCSVGNHRAQGMVGNLVVE